VSSLAGWRSGLLGPRCVEAEKISPTIRRIHAQAHRGSAGAVTLEVTMLEIHPGGDSIVERSECHFDLARFGEIGLELPLGRDLPGEDEFARWVPGEDGAPVAFGVVSLLRVATPAGLLLDDDPLHRRFADVMRTRPPAVHVRREDVKCVGLTRSHGDRLAQGCASLGTVWGHGGHGFLRLRIARASTCWAKASSASVQNWSK